MAEDPSGQNKNSLQPKINQTNRSNDGRHQSGDTTSKWERKVLETNHFVRATKNDRSEEQNPRSMHHLSDIQHGHPPMLTYGSGTWTSTLEHEKMIRSTQRKMLRLTVPLRRKYKKKDKKRKRRTGIYGRRNQQTTPDSDEENSTSTGCDTPMTKWTRLN